MSGIVAQLKDYSKPESIDDEKVNIDDVVKNYPLKILIKNMKKKGIDVRLKLNASKSLIKMPKNRLIQVLMNVLTNADDAIKDKKNGIIRLETRRIEKDSPYITISVKDNGIGIPEENLHKIFEPFFTTKKREGTGLGLSISYSIIKSYNGEIEVTSKPDDGAEFIIYFKEEAS
jgi:C4-dicarboxylate-specific signal transduction histidine kinase